MQQYRWNEVVKEQMNPQFARQGIHSERITIARLELKTGGVVPRHNHENEQISMVLSGRLRFIFDDGESIVGPGEVIQIAPNAFHSVEVLEGGEVIDLFAPVRSDWLRGDDAYLRR